MINSAKISTRELEVLELIVEEMTSNEIAKTLYISHHTVISHRKSLLSKMDAKNSVGLFKRALERGIISLGQANSMHTNHW